MSPKEAKFDKQVLGTTIMGCVEKTFTTMCNMNFSKPPEFSEHEIIEYNSRMRTFGLEKFNGPCFVSAINFYLTAQHLKNQESIGAMIIYLEEDSAIKMLKSLKYQIFDEEDESLIMDNCGEFCNMIAGQFKNELQDLGYHGLTISAPLKGKNDITQGVDFYYDERHYFQADFFFWKKKMLVIVLTLGPVPLIKS